MCLYSGQKHLSDYFSSMLQIALKIELSMTCLSKTLFQMYKLSLELDLAVLQLQICR